MSVPVASMGAGIGKRSRPVTPSGSMRQRTPGSWELRVYAGVDARSGKVRYRTRTVHGPRAAARRALADLVDTVQSGPAFGAEAPLSTLLETWLAAKESIWSAGTMGEARSMHRASVAGTGTRQGSRAGSGQRSQRGCRHRGSPRPRQDCAKLASEKCPPERADGWVSQGRSTARSCLGAYRAATSASLNGSSRWRSGCRTGCRHR